MFFNKILKRSFFILILILSFCAPNVCADEKQDTMDILRAQLANEKDKNSPNYIKNKQKLEKLISKNKENYTDIARLQDIQRLIDEQKYSAATYELNELIEKGFEISKCYELLGDIGIKSQYSSKKIANYYKQAIKEDKDNIDATYKLSKLYLKEKKNLLAIENLKKVIEKTDNCALLEEIKNIITNKIAPLNRYEANNLYEILGDTYIKLGENENSYEAYAKALMINPRDIYLKYYLANLFYEKNLTNDAIKLYNSILNENPKDYQIKSARAKLLAKKENYEEAYLEYKEILQNYPSSNQAIYGIYKIYQNKLEPNKILAKINYKNSNYKPTIKDYREFSKFLAVMEDVQGASDFELFALNLEKQEQEKLEQERQLALNKEKEKVTPKEKPKKEIKKPQEKQTPKITKNKPQKEKKIQEKKQPIVQKKDNLEQKQNELEKKAIEQERKSAIAKNEKKYNELKKTVDKYLSATPQTSANLIAAANTYKQMGEPTSALKYYKQAMKLDPTNSEIYYSLGLTYFEMNDIQNAKTNLTKAINLDTQNTKAKNLLAFVNQKAITKIINQAYDLYIKKQYVPSFEILENGIKEYSQNAQLYYYRALVYDAMNRNAAAIIDLQKAIELDGANYMAYYQLGKLYEKIKDERSALVAYERFLSIEPDEKDLIDEIQKKVISLGAKYY